MKADLENQLWCSRWRQLKREATRDAKCFHQCGGKYVRITGKRGWWCVRAKMPISSLARFASIEAKRECHK